MHADDKIYWKEWNKLAIAQSRKENKPIFLSIGYFSCYWCHVLQRESFKDQTIAELVNKNFIPVIVDRELNTSLDEYLMRFAEETLGRGGWPLNVILTPDGHPLLATIYLPPDKMKSWIQQANSFWVNDPEEMRKIAREAADEMAMSAVLESSKITPDLQFVFEKALITEAMSVADEFQGGFGDQSKFPLPAILISLLKSYTSHPSESFKAFLDLSLTNIRKRGLYDYLSGGYFRYTTDPSWQIPHFEKMLYDNAQIASLYFLASDVLNNAIYQQWGEEQVDYLINNFKLDSQGYFSSYSAIDDKGIEGGSYVWDSEELEKTLSLNEQKITKEIWQWHRPSLFEEGWFPTEDFDLNDATTKLGLDKSSLEKVLNAVRKKLLDQRNKRMIARDEKVITSWNSLVLTALVEGFNATKKDRYQKEATALATFIVEKMFKEGQLQKSIINGVPIGNAELSDYAYTALALQKAAKIVDTQLSIKLRTQAKLLAITAWQRFWEGGGWKTSDTMLIPNLSREAILADGPLPSPSAVLIELSLQLRDEKLNDFVKKALGVGHHQLKTTPFWYASQVNLFSQFLKK